MKAGKDYFSITWLTNWWKILISTWPLIPSTTRKRFGLSLFYLWQAVNALRNSGEYLEWETFVSRWLSISRRAFVFLARCSYNRMFVHSGKWWGFEMSALFFRPDDLWGAVWTEGWVRWAGWPGSCWGCVATGGHQGGGMEEWRALKNWGALLHEQLSGMPRLRNSIKGAFFFVGPIDVFGESRWWNCSQWVKRMEAFVDLFTSGAVSLLGTVTIIS